MWEGLLASWIALRRAGGQALPLLSYQRLDECEAAGRARFGAWIWSAVVATALLILAALVARPGLHTVVLGDHYAALATNPFTPEPNPVGFRLATPLLSHAFGLPGQGLIFTNIVLIWLLLLFVHRYFVLHGRRTGDALAAGGVIALSLVTLSPLSFGGYCDPLTYLALFGAWAGRRHPVRVATCVLIGLANHEAIGFLLPWIALESWWANPNAKRRIALVVGLVASLELYLAYRAGLARVRPVEFSLAYYLDPLAGDPLYWLKRSSPYWLLGLFTVFRLFWVVPVWSGWRAWRERDHRALAGLLLLLAGPAASLFVAFDTSRLWSLAFPAVLVAMARTPDDGSPNWRAPFLSIWLANFLVPPLFTAEQQVVWLHSPLSYVLRGLLQRTN